MSDIFREIEEELRRDNLLKLWARYGRYVIAAAVLAVLIAGGVVGWLDHQKSLRQAQAARYSAALTTARAGKDADAAKVFEAIRAEGGGYAALAAFQDADMKVKAGDLAGAIAAYDRIAASNDYGPEFRDMAVLLSVMHAPPDSDPKALIERLEPLTASGKPWRTTALELTALIKLKAGDRAGALGLYRKLADDLTAPEGLRARAAEMAAALAE